MAHPDRIEVYEVLRRVKRRQPAVTVGWRFRFILNNITDPALLNSTRLYPDAAEASRVATIINRDCFGSHYKLKVST